MSDGRAGQGRSGTIRCPDQHGRTAREIQLQDGRQKGFVRIFHDGLLYEEYVQNERGNRDGLARTYAATPGRNPVTREETLRDGTPVGVVKDWYPDGTRMRLSYHPGDGTEAAVVAFTPKGTLSDLRCAVQPVFAPDFDDATACGFRKPSVVELYSPKETLRGRVTYDHGQRRHIDGFFESGQLAQRVDLTDTGGVDHEFTEAGTPRQDIEWTIRPGDERKTHLITLQRDYHASGKPIREQRWELTPRGTQRTLDAAWYLNGQPKSRSETFTQDGHRLRRDTDFFDSGRKRSEGLWNVDDGDRDGGRETGVHQRFDEAGVLRSESTYDGAGRLARERAWDEHGRLERDDQVFEDGSRKAYAR
jgi:antitoxin component YwqK of YwqJK toxin-antitoxin module